MNEIGGGEIWGAMKRAWMGIIPRRKAATADHAPISMEGYRVLSKGVHIVSSVTCHVWHDCLVALCKHFLCSHVICCPLNLTEQRVYVCFYYLHMCFIENSVGSYYDSYIQMN